MADGTIYFLSMLPLWICVVIADVVVFTIGYKHIMGEWWFVKKEEQDWAVKFSSAGWSVSGKGNSPVDTMHKLVNQMFGLNKSPEDRARDQYEAAVNKEMLALFATEDSQARIREEAQRRFSQIQKHQEEEKKVE